MNIVIFIYYFLVNTNKKFRPKISVFLPIYNKADFLVNCIKSLQNQTLKDIEIVAVNDCSNDKSLEILSNLSIKDRRIKIVNNDKNHGLLYSRAMGILNSSGEYLMNLDPDDKINGDDTLEFLYNKARFYNVDIIAFNTYHQKLNLFIKCIEQNYIIKQPNLFKSIFSKNNVLKEYLIVNKLIKKEIFLSAYEEFKYKIYNGKWNYFEDDIWNILVNRFAKSRICINRLVYIYTYNKNSLMHDSYGFYHFQNLIYRHEMYSRIFNSKNEQKYLIAEYYFLFNRLNSKKDSLLLLKDKMIIDKIIYIFKLFLKKYDVSKSDIKRINNFLNSINLH